MSESIEQLKERAWPRNRWTLVATIILSNIAFNMSTPFLPLFVRDLGVTDPGEAVFWAGLSIGIAPLLAGITSPFWGVIGDRYGVKLLFQRAFLASVCLLLVVSLLVSDVTQLVATRVAFGLIGGYTGVLVAFVVDAAPRGRVTQSVGFIQGIQLASVAAGPAIGGPVADQIGFRLSFILAAGFYLLAATAVTFGLVEFRRTRTAPAGAASEPRRLIGFLPSFVNGWIVSLTLVLLLSQSVERSMMPLLPIYVAVLGTPANAVASVTGLLIAGGGLVAACSANLLGRLASRVSIPNLLLLSLAGAGLSCLAMSLVQTIWQLTAARFSMALLIGGVATLCYGAAATGRGGKTASQMGIIASAGYIAQGIGPMVAGLLGLNDLRRAFVIDGLTLILTAGFVLLVLRPMARRARAAALGPEPRGAMSG